MVRIFKHDTRINLRKRAVDAPLRLIRALYMENQNFFKLAHFKSYNLNLPPKQGVL